MLSLAGTGSGSDPDFLKKIENMVLLADGQVFLKFTDKLWGYSKFNPLTNSRSIDFANHEYATNSPSYGKGVLCADKKTVVFPPRNYHKPLIYNHETGVFNTTSSWTEETVTVTTNRYLAGTLMPDGRVFFPPYHAQYAAIYNPDDDTVRKITSVFSGGSTPAYNGAYLLPNGLIFLIAGTKRFALFDISTFVVTEITDLVNYTRYHHAVMTVDEFLVVFPENGYNNETLIYDYASNTLVNTDNIATFETVCYGSTLAPNGSILCLLGDGLYSVKIKSNGTKVEKNKVHTNSELNVNSRIISLLDGRILIIPEGGTVSDIARIYSSDIELVPFHSSVYLSPFYNRN